MRMFVSSTFEDLKQHRERAIAVLRQLGHEVLAMEDMTAGSIPPLAKVLEMVDRSDAYVGIFAWRYGFLPPAAPTQPADNAQKKRKKFRSPITNINGPQSANFRLLLSCWTKITLGRRTSLTVSIRHVRMRLKTRTTSTS
jgi:hypothetical protein